MNDTLWHKHAHKIVITTKEGEVIVIYRYVSEDTARQYAQLCVDSGDETAQVFSPPRGDARKLVAQFPIKH